MPQTTITCASPDCGALSTTYWQPSKRLPRYCSRACWRIHAHALRKAAGVPPRRKFVFTESMNTALTNAYRKGFGRVARLWREDPQFARAGVTYAVVKRQCKILGLTRTVPHETWHIEEETLCITLYTKGYALETIRKKLAQAGYARTPSAITSHMRRLRETRHGDMLSLAEVAQALGVDHHVVERWVRQGLLPVASTSVSGRFEYVGYPALRRFVVEHPALAAQGAVDVVWLIALLVPPSVGETRDRSTAAATADTSWLGGEVVRDRAAAD